MTPEVFVYWHAEPAAADAAIVAARAFQRALCRDHAGLAARLYRRADTARGRVTVMETYASASGMDEGLHAALAAAGTQAPAAWCPGTRHVEVFESIG